MTPKEIETKILIQKQIDGYVEKYGWDFQEQRDNDLVFKNGEHKMVVVISENDDNQVFEDGEKVPNMYPL